MEQQFTSQLTSRKLAGWIALFIALLYALWHIPSSQTGSSYTYAPPNDTLALDGPPGGGIGIKCIACTDLDSIFTKGYDFREAPPCHWGQDIVLIAKTPSCITLKAVQRLEKFLQPRRFHVVTTSDEKCEYFKAMSPKVRCYNENHVWKDWNFAKVRATFRKHFPNNEGWHLRVGWYFQQLLKLGAANYLGTNLTEHYMVWDADMVMLAPVYPTCYDKESEAVRMVLECGGWRAPGYLATYKNIFGEDMVHPKIGSFVGHRMVAKKGLMLQLLEDLKGEEDSWQENIIKNVDAEHIYTGFSEYATYGSWMVKTHGDEAYTKPRVTWIRHLEWNLPTSGPCCPTDHDFRAFFHAHDHHVSYVGVELGHIDDPDYGELYKQCNAHAEENKVAYGLDGLLR